MEWTKIKAKHFLYTDFTLMELGALSKLLCLTAHLERIPTPIEVSRQVPQPIYRALTRRLQTHHTTLIGVLAKVLEDVEGMEHKRSISRSTSKRYRAHAKELSIGGDVSCDTTEKKRVEKKRIYSEWFVTAWSLYPKKLGRRAAERHFNASVKTDHDYELIKKAIENYKGYIEHKKVEDQYIQHGSTFFNNWADWAEYKGPGHKSDAVKKLEAHIDAEQQSANQSS